MTYPELDLEASLAGAPVIMMWEPNCEDIGYLHKSKALKDDYFFEYSDGTATARCSGMKIKQVARMYVEPIVFGHWGFIAECYTKMEKTAELDDHLWRLSNSEGDIFYYFNQGSFAHGFFPDCPVGTVIHRPKESNQ